MSSFVYLMHVPHTDEEWCHDGELYKIGVTTNLKQRLIDLRKYWEKNIEYITFIPTSSNSSYSIEKILHTQYNNKLCTNPFKHKYSSYRELFIFNDNDINDIILNMWSYSNIENNCEVNTNKFEDIYLSNKLLKLENEKLNNENIHLKYTIENFDKSFKLKQDQLYHCEKEIINFILKGEDKKYYTYGVIECIKNIFNDSYKILNKEVI